MAVAVVNPIQQAYIHRAAHEAGAAMEGMKKLKRDRAQEGLDTAGISFLPLVMESFGGWDSDAAQLVKKIARQDSSQPRAG